MSNRPEEDVEGSRRTAPEDIAKSGGRIALGLVAPESVVTDTQDPDTRNSTRQVRVPGTIISVRPYRGYITWPRRRISRPPLE